jgi:hypothetical protein
MVRGGRRVARRRLRWIIRLRQESINPPEKNKTIVAHCNSLSRAAASGQGRRARTDKILEKMEHVVVHQGLKDNYLLKRRENAAHSSHVDYSDAQIP